MRYSSFCSALFDWLTVRFIKLRWQIGRRWRKLLPRSKKTNLRVEYDFKGIRRVDLSLLKPGETLVVQTENTLYQLVIAPDGPPEAVVYAQSSHFPEPRRVRLNGSVLDPEGSSIYAALLIRGLHMELGLEGQRRIRTSVVKQIFVGGLNVIDELSARVMHVDTKTSVITRH